MQTDLSLPDSTTPDSPEIRPALPIRPLAIVILTSLFLVAYDQLYLFPGFISMPLILLLLFGLLSFAFIGIVAILARLFSKVRRTENPSALPQIRWQYFALLLSGLALVYVVHQSKAVLRGAFVLVKPQLQTIMDMEDPAKASGGYLFFWFLKSAERDERGGTYFQLAEAMDTVDTDYVGFVYQPNKEGSPWGRAKYETIPIQGDWHIFYANCDY